MASKVQFESLIIVYNIIFKLSFGRKICTPSGGVFKF